MKSLKTSSVLKLARAAAALCILWAGLSGAARAQSIALQCDPAQTVANFTLSDPLHTVHGAFKLKSCDVRFDPVSGKIDGAIVFDATSGNSGSGGRDKKMHKGVLESARYPEITFRPDRVDGKVALAGASSVQVHGMFGIHGSEHEITMPVALNLDSDHWNASAKFSVPYVKWGMKNPSMLFLKVGESVDLDFKGTGGVKPAGQ